MYTHYGIKNIPPNISEIITLYSSNLPGVGKKAMTLFMLKKFSEHAATVAAYEREEHQKLIAMIGQSHGFSSILHSTVHMYKKELKIIEKKFKQLLEPIGNYFDTLD